MNKKSFVLLAAALTGVTTVAVGAVAISGANQMSKFSVGTNATSRTITFNSSSIDPEHGIAPDGYYYIFEISSKTAVYNRDFTNDIEGSYFSCDSYRAGVDGYILEITCSGSYDYEEQLFCEFIFDCNAPITDVSAQFDIDGEPYGFNLESGTSMKFVDVYQKEVKGVEKNIVQLSVASSYDEKVIGWKSLTITYNY